MAGKVADLPNKRAGNLRQRLLQASRQVNIAIVKGLNDLEFDELRSTHTALLSNLDLDGASLTVVARNAGMTKQAMGRLADDLVHLGYITKTPDKTDRRTVHLTFTDKGLDLMHKSFAVMDEIEKRCANCIGLDSYRKLLASLSKIAKELDDG
jgi:DNA-binding MarR family transcriptional regulator